VSRYQVSTDARDQAVMILVRTITNPWCSLAWAELRLGLAHTLRKFDFSLAEPM
jgi:hypothetical protein